MNWDFQWRWWRGLGVCLGVRGRRWVYLGGLRRPGAGEPCALRKVVCTELANWAGGRLLGREERSHHLTKARRVDDMPASQGFGAFVHGFHANWAHVRHDAADERTPANRLREQI